MTQSEAPHVFATVVLYNTISVHGETSLVRSIGSLLEQQGFALDNNLTIAVIDNNSTDTTYQVAQKRFGSLINVSRNRENLGYCGAQNQGVRLFLHSGAEYLLLFTHDVALQKDALSRLVESFNADPQIGAVTPKLVQADENLEPLPSGAIDAAGMILTRSLRHLDRKSPGSNAFERDEFVFGGTGACLLLSRDAVIDALIDGGNEEESLFEIYPALRSEREKRAPLFDEAFFAYREDADLSWRLGLFGWKIRYSARAVGYHRRVVLPERRKVVSKEVNCWSVRNRFLLQINNYFFWNFPGAFLPGIVFRNWIVVLGVILFERSSYRAFTELRALHSRARARRALIRSKMIERKHRPFSCGNNPVGSCV